MFPQKDNSNLFQQRYLFLFTFPASLLPFILPPQTPSIPTPLLSFCQNHPLKLQFLTPQPTKLSKTQFSASKSPTQQAIHQTDKHKIRTFTHASSGRRKTRTFTFSAFKSRHHDDSCTSSRAIQKTTVVISGNHRAASGEGPR